MNRKLNWFAGLMAFSAISAHAVSADEAKALGTTLTPIGAEKAANAAGTIPAYTGGLTAAPAGFKAGDGIRPDPYRGGEAAPADRRQEHGDRMRRS